MIALVLSPNWTKYYASSPYLNLLRANHPRYTHFHVHPHELSDTSLQEQINACRAVVTDDVLVHSISFYTKGPKILVGGDRHAFTKEDVVERERQYRAVDYVLSSMIYSTTHPRYFYLPTELEKRCVYFPNSVPSTVPPGGSWYDRSDMTLMSGSHNPLVYPFRDEARSLPGVYQLPQWKMQHEEYFEELAKYKMAITCNSVLQYTVSKYLEIPWVGTLLLASELPYQERDLMGIESGKNCLLFNKVSEVTSAMQEVLNNKEHFEKVAREGAELMRRSHTVTTRLNYLAIIVDKMVAGGFVPGDELNFFKQVS